MVNKDYHNTDHDNLHQQEHNLTLPADVHVATKRNDIFRYIFFQCTTLLYLYGWDLLTEIINNYCRIDERIVRYRNDFVRCSLFYCNACASLTVFKNFRRYLQLATGVQMI